MRGVSQADLLKRYFLVTQKKGKRLGLHLKELSAYPSPGPLALVTFPNPLPPRSSVKLRHPLAVEYLPSLSALVLVCVCARARSRACVCLCRAACLVRVREHYLDETW